ncbi:MAG TPA: RNA polymerase sigma factor [Bryobacterales bacterium]|nr:RNA polymerase sigma factor [Bryobacterales bacterium]
MMAAAKPGSEVDAPTLEELMASYQRADPAAAAELIRQASPVLFRFFVADAATRAYADDLLQDCWLRIHKSRHTYRLGEPVMPWIFAIARHTRVDGFERRRRIESHEVAVDEFPQVPVRAEAAPGDGPPADGFGTSGFAASDLSRLINALPQSQREVILMLKVSGMSLEEVARATSSTVGAIKQKAHRAYRRLRQALGETSAVGGPLGGPS